MKPKTQVDIKLNKKMKAVVTLVDTGEEIKNLTDDDFVIKSI